MQLYDALYSIRISIGLIIGIDLYLLPFIGYWNINMYWTISLKADRSKVPSTYLTLGIQFTYTYLQIFLSIAFL